MRRVRELLGAALLLCVAACAAGPEPLMNPPVVLALGSAEGVPAASD